MPGVLEPCEHDYETFCTWFRCRRRTKRNRGTVRAQFDLSSVTACCTSIPVRATRTSRPRFTIVLVSAVVRGIRARWNWKKDGETVGRRKRSFRRSGVYNCKSLNHHYLIAAACAYYCVSYRVPEIGNVWRTAFVAPREVRSGCAKISKPRPNIRHEDFSPAFRCFPAEHEDVWYTNTANRPDRLVSPASCARGKTDSVRREIAHFNISNGTRKYTGIPLTEIKII